MPPAEPPAETKDRLCEPPSISALIAAGRLIGIVFLRIPSENDP